ncbi:UNVERIFIED_CONTAM: hypothetical protein H355_012258 [Colinus virginianus]|nr:hypothetical protein H355_012258 [Colinus virginianus]
MTEQRNAAAPRRHTALWRQRLQSALGGAGPSGCPGDGVALPPALREGRTVLAFAVILLMALENQFRLERLMAWMTYISHWFDEDDWYEGQQRAKMSQVRQVGLLAAGCQPWNKDVCAASGDRFAYCATLAIYIYQLDHQYNEFKLRAIMSEHKKTITAISWCPHNPDMFASASADSLVIVWNVTEQKVVAKLDDTKGSKNQKHVLRPESLKGTDEEDPVTALEWDPLSTDYLLVANLHNGIQLVDSESLSCITKFTFPSAAASVQCLAWVHSAPGMFITGAFSFSSPIKYPHTSSTSEAVPPPTLTQKQAFSLPPGHVVCCFMDGGVGLYDMGAKKWDFLRDLGHVETIFDCEFKPDNPDLLATASFDGTIKVWDINTLTAVYTSPGDLNCIAGATSRNGGFIWDVPRGKIITRFSEHGKNGIFCIAWSHKDSKRIATCSDDGFCIIRTIDGKILHKYKHPAAVFGCDWSQNNKDMIATGCEDKNVRVYYLATSSDQPLKVFTGHTAKVFHVRWSPLREGILCSGSDDGTVRIWDYTKDACINILSGHKAPVRGLMWNPEIPYLLVSGSWDYSIQVWDTRDGTCLDTVYDHGADVYGLTCHPSRPFTMASCSRDSTVRLWSLTPLINPLPINILADRCWDEVIGNIDRAVESGAPPLLCGKVSRDIKQEVEKTIENPRGEKLRRADQLIQEENDDVIPYCIAIGDVKKLVSFFTSRGQLKEALLVAQAACEGNIQMSPLSTVSGSSNSDLNNTDDYNIKLAMANLIRGNELELAISVGTVLGESAAQATHYALELLARKCMTVTTWDLAADLLMMIPDNKLQLVKLCAFYPGCTAERNDLHEKCNLPNVEECMRLAETTEADGDIFETIKYYLLSSEPEKALPIGIQYVKEQLCGSDWTLDSVCPYLDLLSYIRTEQLMLNNCTQFRNELLILCGYIGALLAIRRQYNSIVPALYEYTRSTNELPCTPPSEAQKKVYSILVSRIQEEPLKGMIGPDYVTGSNLPSHSDVHVSCLTGLRIQGPVFFLEDGKSTISLNDALMWAKVNPFSPLGTGIRLNPF